MHAAPIFSADHSSLTTLKTVAASAPKASPLTNGKSAQYHISVT